MRAHGPFHFEGHGLTNYTPLPLNTPPPGVVQFTSPLHRNKPIPLQPRQDTARPQAEQQATTYATTPLPQLEPP